MYLVDVIRSLRGPGGFPQKPLGEPLSPHRWPSSTQIGVKMDLMTTQTTQGTSRGEAASLVPSLLRSVSVFRFAALAWAVGGVALSTEHLEQPFGAVALLTLMAVTTVALALWHYRPSWGSMARPWVVVAELFVGVVVLIGDGLVYADERAQSLLSLIHI